MATNDELTPEVLEELRAALEQKRDRLRSELSGLQRTEASEGRTSGTGDDFAGDPGDDSVDLEEIDRDVATGDVLQRALEEVQRALAKVDAGTYGISEASGRPIPLARLRALPEARYDAQDEAMVEARGRSAQA